MRNHKPYYSLQVLTPEGRTLVCTFIGGDGSRVNKLSLGFNDQKDYMQTAFGGHHFSSEKQAWWHWYTACEYNPRLKELGKPVVVDFEP